MTEESTHPPVPFRDKFAFGVGMLANQMFPAVLGIFMIVLVQDLGFPGWMWGVLFFLPRVFDSLSDPIMGFISEGFGLRVSFGFVAILLLCVPAILALMRRAG